MADKPDNQTASPVSYPLLALRRGVLFPGTNLSLPVGRPRSVAAIKEVGEDVPLIVAVQRDANIDDPTIDDLEPIATLAKVHRVVRNGNHYRAVFEGLHRFRLDELQASGEFYVGAGVELPNEEDSSLEVRALGESLIERFQSTEPSLSDNLKSALADTTLIDNPGKVADIVGTALGLPQERAVEVLQAVSVRERLETVHRYVADAETYAEVKKRIDRKVREEFNKNQKEAVLRQQMKAIRKELGDDGDNSPLARLKKKLDGIELPADAQEVVDREVGRLEDGNAVGAEQQVILKYLELIAELPWDKRADSDLDIPRVREKLEEDHYALDDVKRRILEHLSVQKLTGSLQGTILNLHGPPGVGKSSLARSIADAMDRPFVRVSLGGVRDEAEIRGHRRTYIGALPGRIISAIRKAGVRNPVILLDEVDKLGKGWAGDPEAALLEVLDPEQNSDFTDHFLEIGFDLSEVFFICTANRMDTLSPPLRDRLETIDIDGYTTHEKLEIARRHVLPQELAEHGLSHENLSIDDEVLTKIIRGYTREAGVRQIKRELKKIIRRVALDIASDDTESVETRVIGDVELHDILGRKKYYDDVAERTSIAGVATGLAWTSVGGDILFIETTKMPGKGKLEITGQLGDVMQESARAALSYLRSNTDVLNIDPDFLTDIDIHIHVPQGATPKDGPSAGVTIFTALTSLLTGRMVRADTAMTGECTLRGKVLPVGGIKSKVLAAHRAGIQRVILPNRNERDIDDVPEDVRSEMEFIFASDMSEVLNAALEDHVDATIHEPDAGDSDTAHLA